MEAENAFLREEIAALHEKIARLYAENRWTHRELYALHRAQPGTERPEAFWQASADEQAEFLALGERLAANIAENFNNRREQEARKAERAAGVGR